MWIKSRLERVSHSQLMRAGIGKRITDTKKLQEYAVTANDLE